MNYEELSAQQAAIDKAIEAVTAAEKMERFDKDVYALLDAAQAWAAIAEAITLHNDSVVTSALANAAVEFIKNPSPDAYTSLVESAASYTTTQ